MRSFLRQLIIFGLFLAIALEALFRTAIPASEAPVGRQDPVHMIMTLDPGASRDGHSTQGRLGRHARRWHVNNYGFNSDRDYVRFAERDRPCVAVIGNSYIEGLVNDVDEHLAARLQEAYGERADVYNLGVSGMPFSQYPLMARFAEAEFKPDLIILAVGGASIDRSLRSGGMVRFSQQFAVEADSLVALPPSRFQVSRKNRLIRASAVVRYLFYNAKVNLGGAGDVVRAADVPADSTHAEDAAIRDLHDQVLDRIFEEIAAASPGTPVLVVCDADRRGIYASREKPAPLRASAVIREACGRNGAHFLDMTDHFWSRYQVDGRRFDSPADYHWDDYGVEVVRDAIWAELSRLGLADLGPGHPGL